MQVPERLAYGKVANAYDAFLTFSGFRRGIEHFLDRQRLDLPARPRILDAGCGTGLISRYLAGRFPSSRILAFDIDPAMLRAMARELASDGINDGNIAIAHGDLRNPHRLHLIRTHESTAIPEASLDAIFVSGALEHVPLGETVARLARLLKPGGLFFNLGVRRNPAGAVLGMVYRFRPYRIAELRQVFADAGLQEIRTLRLSVEDFPANLSRIAITAQKLENRK